MANISQIKVADTVYDIEALRFVAGELNTPAQWKSYIDQMAAIGFDIVVLTTLPEESAASYETYKNNIVLINDSNSVTGSSIEYVMVRSGTSESYTYRWERIGTTTADLNSYAKKGTETLGPSNESTGSTDIGEKTTSEVAESISAANVSLKYKLAGTTTGSAGGTTTTSTDDAGAHTIDGSNFTFTGADKSIEVSVNRIADVAIDNHPYTPEGTVNINHNAIKDITLTSSTSTTAGPKYVESVAYTAATLGDTTTFNTDAIKSAVLSTSTTTSQNAIPYVESITYTAATLKNTTTFNTDAIKDVKLSASTTSSDGPAYVESITYNPASLKDTTTFVTGYNNFSGGSGALESYDAETNGTKKIANGKRIPYISGLTYTPASLGNASTGTVGISGGSYNGTTKYMKVSITNADTGTVSINGGSGSLTVDTTSTNGIGVVTSQGSFSAGSLPSLTITSKSPSKISSWSAGKMFNASVSGNILVLDAGSAPSLSYAAESVGSASGWSAGSLPSLGSATTKYLHHSHTGASLSGTTTFTTNGIKAVSLNTSTTTSTDALAYTESISGSAPSLTGTKTFVTGYNSFSGGSMSPTTYYLAHGHTSASLGSASTGTVGINGGSVTPTIKYMKKSVTAASTSSVGINGGGVTPVIKYANIATTAASKGTVTISSGSVTPVTKYLSKSILAATLTPSFVGTATTISHTVTQPTFTGTFNNKSIAGTIGGSQSVAGHSHTYVELKEHTHSISHTDANVSGSVEVPIPAHTHTVVIGEHTHTLNNHTHKQQ